MASWQPAVTMIDAAGTRMPSSMSSMRAISGPICPLVRPYCIREVRIRAGSMPLSPRCFR